MNLGLREFKKGFIDTRKILNRVDKARMSALTKPAALVRLRAINSMKSVGKLPRKDLFAIAVRFGMARSREDYRNMSQQQWAQLVLSSDKEAHSPPGVPPYAHVGYIKKFMLYGLDKKKMVVGPAKLGNQLVYAGYTVPHILEFGGETAQRIPGGRVITVRVAARPFMRPALNHVIARGEMRKAWKGAVTA